MLRWARQPYRLLSTRAIHEAVPFLLCIVTTISGYVSYHAKLYHCRPSSNHMQTWKTLIELTITTGVDEGGTCKVLENKLERTKVDIWYSGAKV